MKKKIISLFYLLCGIISIGANLPKEYKQKEHESCHTEKKYKEECEYKHYIRIECVGEEPHPCLKTKEYGYDIKNCKKVPYDEEVCSTSYYNEWTGKYETRDIEASIVKHVEKEAELRYNAEKATAEQLFRAEKEHKTIEQVVNEDKQRFKDRSYSAQQSYSHDTGDDITKNERYRATINNREQDKIRKEDMDVAGEDAIKKSNKAANSKWIRKLHEAEYGIKGTDKYYNNEYGVDPVLPPIRVKDKSEITEEMKKQGRPIFIEESKKPDSSSSGGSSSDSSTWDTPSYSYYTISYNKNGADSGSVPNSVTKRSDRSYVKIAGNYGNLIKEGYKFVGWNTKANGTGTTYEEGEYKRLYSNMVLYAKWEKVEKVKPSKPIEHKTYYQIKFINGDHITITGDKSKVIEKGKPINYVPSIKVDNEFKFKYWLGSDGNTYTDDGVKELIPTSSINFLAIVEGEEKPKPVPKPEKVKEKYNITFTANEHSKLKGTSNLEVEEQTKINNVPEVIADKGYAFKNWLGSDGNTYTIDAIKELIPTTDMSFLVVTEVDKNAKVIVPWEVLTPANPIEKPKVGKKREKPFVQYIPIEVYVGDEVNVEDVVTSTSNGWDAMTKSWYFKPDTSKVGKAKGGIISIIDLVSKQAWHDFPEVDTITVLPKPELSYKHDTIYLDKEVTVDNCINRTLSDRYQVNIIGKVDTSTIGKKEVHLEVIDAKLNRKFTGYTSYITVKEDMDKLTYNTDYIYVGDKVTLNDVIEPKNIPSKYKIEIIGTPDTNKAGLTLVNLKISNPKSNSVWNVTSNVRVINKPTLIYKNPRRKLINNDILESDVVDKVIVEGDNEFKPSTYTYKITNQIDTITIGTKVVELKVTDTHKNRVFIGYTTDITLYENLENLNYKPDPEIYEGDDTKVDDIIDKKDIPSKYNITIKIPADSKTPGRKITRIIISNPTSGSVWEVDRPITVLPKPTLVYKNPRRKHINLEIVPDDVVANKLDERYTIHITNEIDIKTIGTKPVELKIIDTKLNNREFTGFTTDITLYEDLLDLNYKPNPEIYVGDPTTVDDIINKKDIPSIYKIEIKTPADSTTPGRKTTKIKISNPTSGSVWEVDRPIEVLPEPELIGKDLWIYQNDKDPDDKGRKFISKITVDLNNRFKGRYKVEYKGHGDISKVGKTKFTYIIIDLQRNRKFEKQIEIEVREEIINPKFNENTERYIGHIFTPDELVEGIDKTVYIPEITNKEEMMEFRLTPGKKTVKIKITSTITGKVWTYDIPVIYKEKIVDLGELLWEKGEILTIEDIRKHKNLPKDHTITIRKGDLDTTQLGSKTIELVIMDKDRVYYVGILKITIVENKTIEDIHRIDDGTKVHLITYVDDISNRATKKLINKSKSKDLWFEQTNNFLKYNLDQKANIIGGRLGYDHYFENQKAVLGGYAGYDRATWNLSDKSKQNMFHIGMYGAKELHESNSGKNKLYLGGVTQYTFINGDINVKNIRNERITYKQTAHNILANAFVGTSYEYSENSNIALNLGDTLLYNFNNKYIGKTQNVNLKNNIANEFYVELMANKRWNKLNVHSTLKLGYLYGKTEYSLNKAVWNYVLKKFNIKATAGADYDVTDNFTIGVEGFYKHHDKNIKLDAGIKGKLEYRW